MNPFGGGRPFVGPAPRDIIAHTRTLAAQEPTAQLYEVVLQETPDVARARSRGQSDADRCAPRLSLGQTNQLELFGRARGRHPPRPRARARRLSRGPRRDEPPGAERLLLRDLLPRLSVLAPQEEIDICNAVDYSCNAMNDSDR
jgi:hypothetical protein